MKDKDNKPQVYQESYFFKLLAGRQDRQVYQEPYFKLLGGVGFGGGYFSFKNNDILFGVISGIALVILAVAAWIKYKNR